MGKPRKKSWSSNGNEEEEDSLFANKFFFEGLLAQKGTPEARQHEEIANALWDLLEDDNSTPGNARSSGPMRSGSISSSPFSEFRNSVPPFREIVSRILCFSGLKSVTTLKTTLKRNWTS